MRNAVGEKLVQFCEARGLAVGNTFFSHSPTATLTHRGISGDLMTLDYALVRRTRLSTLCDVRARAGANLAFHFSDHHPLEVTFRLKLALRDGQGGRVARRPSPDVAALGDPAVRAAFQARVEAELEGVVSESAADYPAVATVITAAAEAVLPARPVVTARYAFSEEARELGQERRDVAAQARAGDRSPEVRAQLTDLRQRQRTLVRREALTKAERLVEELWSAARWRSGAQFWRVLQSHRRGGGAKAKVAGVLNDAGVAAATEEAEAAALTEHSRRVLGGAGVEPDPEVVAELEERTASAVRVPDPPEPAEADIVAAVAFHQGWSPILHGLCRSVLFARLPIGCSLSSAWSSPGR